MHMCVKPLKKTTKELPFYTAINSDPPTCLFTTFTTDSDSYINKKLIMTVTMTVT